MQGKGAKQKREGTARILIGAVLLAAVFLCTQLAVLFVQSCVYDYEYYLMDELKQASTNLWLQLESAPQEQTLAEALDGLETYLSTHDITDNIYNTYHATNARLTMTMRPGEAAEQELFTYDRQHGFVRQPLEEQRISSGDMAQAVADGTYVSVRNDGAASPDMYAALSFESDGITYTLRMAIPANEPLMRSLPIVLGVVACVVVLGVLLFLFLRHNQSVFYRQAMQNAKRTQLVLDHLNTSVHVSRPETGELLFVNKAMREAFNVSENDIGKPCWEVLKHDVNSRCQYCPLYQLMGSPDQSITWELCQGDTGKCYLNTDALIEWDDGSTVLMEHASDITEQKRTLQRMRRQIEQQKLVSQLSIEVATHMDQQLVGHLLAEVGTFLDLDRAWVARNLDNTGRMEYLYEWHKPQLRAMSTYVPELVMTLYGEGRTAKLDTNVTLVPMPQDLPVADSTPFEQMRLYSNAYVSLMVGGEPWGLLFLAMQERTREWSQGDMAFVRTFSGILSTTLQNTIIQGRLQETQRMLRSVLEHIPLGIYWKDKDSRYMGANQRFLAMMGLEQDQVEGLTDADIFPEDEAENFTETDQITMRTGEIYEDSVRIKPDNHLPSRWLRRKKLAVWEEDGQMAFILGIVEDITDQRNAEKKRDESLSMLRAAMQNYPGILFSLDEDHRIAVMGGKSPFGQQDGQDNDSLMGRPVEEVYAKYPEMVSRILATYGQGAQNFSISEENKVYNFFTAQILGPEGIITGVVVTGLDMTQEMQLRKELEDAIVTAENASSAKSDFLSRMSHEIRTPMNVIIGMCRMALRAKDTTKVKHSLMQIDASAKHLLGLINDILDMSKIEANKLVLHNEQFDLEKMLMDVCAGVQVRAGERHQTIQVLMARGMPHFFIGDELRLSQVITNLFTNAIKFSPDHGNIVLSMKVLETEGEMLTLETRVRDHGIGMTQEQIDKLFVSFEQADGGIARKYGGTGLGLAICKSIVTMMDGDIWAESEYGKGSTFVFTVKMQSAPEQAKSDTSRDLKGQNLHTLVVDDSVEICEYIVGIMEGFGIACDKALSGKEALNRVATRVEAGEGPYDIVFVDWQMPDMDGIETIRKLREVSPKQVPVIMISSADLSEVEDEAKALGVKHFVPKPLFPSDLFNVVHNILGLGSIASSKQSDTTTVGSAPNLSGHVILLAEDMEFNREVAIGILEETGCEVDEAINGMEAVEKFEANPTRYSCILMDMQMPGVDGLEATRMIRAMKNIPWAKKIPIIAMTANVFKDDIEECLEAGMDDHIGKPISDSVLYEKLAFYLHSADNQRRTEPEGATAEEMGAAQGQDLNPETFLPYVGVEQGLARLRDNKKLYTTLLGSFLRNTKAEDLLVQIRDGDLEEAAKTAHALKGIAGNIELTELYRMSAEMEETLKVGARPTEGATEAFAEAYQRTMDLIPQVTKYLSKGLEG